MGGKNVFLRDLGVNELNREHVEQFGHFDAGHTLCDFSQDFATIWHSHDFLGVGPISCLIAGQS